MSKFILLFGGNSYEHEISIISAITLSKKLDGISHFVFVDSASNSYLIAKDKMTSKYFSSVEYKEAPQLSLINGGFIKKKLFGSEFIGGIIINLIHGKSGEDGQISSILDFYNISYIGPRVESSVISYNKELTKLYAKSRGVNVLDYQVLHKDKGIELEYKLPVILKPSRLGSSIGISIIKDIADFPYAIDTVFEYDDSAIIEGFIPNIKEYNLAGCKVGDEFIFSMIEEVSKDEFLDFDKKYLDFRGEGDVKEAKLSDELINEIKNNFIMIYENCFEGALIRCDFFIIDDKIYLNEINPVPGSLAYYLFDDFNIIVERLSSSLPSNKRINTQYKYISKIQSIKGK